MIGLRTCGRIFFSLTSLLVLLLAVSCDKSEVVMANTTSVQDSISNEKTSDNTILTVTDFPVVTSEAQQGSSESEDTEPVAQDTSSATKELYAGLATIEALEKPESLEGRFSYTYGYLVMDAAFRDLEEIDSDYFIKGILDFTLDKDPFFSSEQMGTILFEYNEKMVHEAANRFAEFSEKNLREAETFLEVNKMHEHVITTDSGLQYEILESGDGPKPKATDTVRVNYELNYLDGRIGESSPKGNPSTFALPALIDGFKEGLMLMPVGSTYRFWVHPNLGYGESGSSQVEPNSLLIFDVELVEIID